MPITEGDLSLPNGWHANIEKSKEKARKMLKKVAAIEINNSVMIGIIDEVSIDKLFKLKYPFCKIMLKNIKKYSMNEKLETKMEEQILFVNKPEMILDLKELASKFPNIFEDVHVEMRKGVY